VGGRLVVRAAFRRPRRDVDRRRFGDFIDAHHWIDGAVFRSYGKETGTYWRMETRRDSDVDQLFVLTQRGGRDMSDMPRDLL